MVQAEAISTVKQIQSEYLYVLKQHLTAELREYLPFAQASVSLLQCINITPVEKSALVIPRSGGPSLSPNDFRTQCLVDDILTFWRQKGDTLLNAITELSGLGISVFAESSALDPIKKHSLYFDTVFLEDRIFGDASMAFVHDTPLAKYQYAVFRGKFLGLLILEPLIAANTSMPLVVVYPDPHFLRVFKNEEPSALQNFRTIVQDKTLRFFQESFPEVADIDQLLDVLGPRLDTTVVAKLNRNQYLREMVNGETVDALANWFAFQRNLESSGENGPDFKSLNERLIGLNVLEAVKTKIHHQERISLTFHACKLDPSLDQLSWPVFNWDMRIQAEKTAQALGFSEELAVPKIIEKPSLAWLGNLNIDDLIDIHQSDQIVELRRVFSAYRRRIRFAKPEEFERVLADIAADIDASVDEYAHIQKKTLQALSRRRGFTWATFLVSGALAVASIACPALLPLAVASAVVGLTVGSSVANIVDERKTTEKVKREIALRPLGILLTIKTRPTERTAQAD